MSLIAEQVTDERKRVLHPDPDEQPFSPGWKSSITEFSGDHPYRRRRL
jgi:hypothetical protein